jgi:hypothetical protein
LKLNPVQGWSIKKFELLSHLINQQGLGDDKKTKTPIKLRKLEKK